MPELPEVETVVLGLKELLINHSIKKVQTDWPRSLRLSEEQQKMLINSRFIDVRRRGKMIILDLSSHQSLIIHLKLSGQLVYRGSNLAFGAGHPSSSLVGQLPDSTTRVIFSLDKKAILYFNDVRKFGWIKMHATDELEDLPLFQSLGPDALSVSESEFLQILQHRGKSIKACLLDQTILAGCGNIYADESLWASRIHPKTAARDVPKTALKQLCQKLQQILKLSLAQGGSSSKNYINARGEKGQYLKFAKVYQRRDMPCFRCPSLIRRVVVAGRGTHFCPLCQKYNRGHSGG